MTTVTAVFRDIVKLSLSMLIAFVVLNAFCYFYYHLAIHHDNDSGATDYKWTPNYSIRRGTEGFAVSRTNNDGHMNSFDWHPGDRVKILIMGNSHMEAGNVMTDESVASRLNSMLGDRSVYNIGTSGHHLVTIANNVRAAVRRYRPEKFIIINITSIYPSGEAIKKMLDGEYKRIPSYSGGIVGFLQKSDYLRLIWAQYKNFQRQHQTKKPQSEPEKNDWQLIGRMLAKVQRDAGDGLGVIIVYHPSIKLDHDGKLNFTHEAEDVQHFAKICAETNIEFLDMSTRFAKEYEESHILPNGFINTPVGAGHLNREGHRMIADELYRMILEVK